MLLVHLQAVIRGRNAVAAVGAREKIIASHLIALPNNPVVYSHQYAPDDYAQRLLRKYGSTKKPPFTPLPTATASTTQYR